MLLITVIMTCRSHIKIVFHQHHGKYLLSMAVKKQETSEILSESDEHDTINDNDPRSNNTSNSNSSDSDCECEESR